MECRKFYITALFNTCITHPYRQLRHKKAACMPKYNDNVFSKKILKKLVLISKIP
jgi:hypothetical protein